MYSGNFKRGPSGSTGGSRGGSRPSFSQPERSFSRAGGGSRFSKSPTARPAGGHAPYHSHSSSGSAGGFSRGPARLPASASHRQAGGGNFRGQSSSGGRFGGGNRGLFAGGKRFGGPAGQRIDISKF